MYCNPRWALAAVPLVLLTACHRQPARPAFERIAVLRFENLGASPADDWVGRAFSEVIAAQLEGAPGVYAIPAIRLHAIDAGYGQRPPDAPGISAERTAALTAGASQIAYGQYRIRNGTLQAWLTVEDTLGGKMTSLTPAQAPVAEFFSVASSLARQLSPHITPFGTRNLQVTRTYVETLEGTDPKGQEESVQQALAADPDFGPSYRRLAQLKAQRKDTEGALAALQQGLARGNAIPEAERARIQLQASLLLNDAPGRLQALTALAKADPNDPQTWRDLGSSAVAAHRYPQAVEAFRKAVTLQPEDADSWNQLGYSAAYTGDSATAASALEEYRKQLPDSPNPLDSLGDANLIAGRLPEAEKYYLEGARKNAQFFNGLDLLKAAMARLMTGDMAGADTLAQQYFDARTAAKDPLVEYRKAQWSWIGGHRKEACRQLEKVAQGAESAAQREVAGHAYAELALWTLMLGNREASAAVAQKAVALATPTSVTAAVLSRFLSQPPASVSEWQARATQAAPNPAQAQVRSLAMAMAFLVGKEYAAAVPVLRQMYDTGSPAADEGIGVLLAWAYLETGRVAEAAPLLKPNPPLSDVGLTWSTPLHFPRIYYLRGVAAAKQGKADEARENFKLFRQLSGPDPLMWGEEQKAQ